MGRLDLSGCRDLVFIDLYRNWLTSVDLADMPALRILGLQGNRIEVLDPAGLSSCQGIDAKVNRLTSIDMPRNPELVELYVNDSRIRTLDASRNPKLKYLRRQNNLLSEIDTSVTKLYQRGCGANSPQLVYTLAVKPDLKIHDLGLCRGAFKVCTLIAAFTYEKQMRFCSWHACEV